MKILYAGQINPEYVSTTRLRMDAIAELGHEVQPFCVMPYHRWGCCRLARSLAHRLAWGPGFWKLNADLAAAAESFRPDVLWVDKGTWITPDTLRQIKNICGCALVHYTPDPAIVHHRTRHFIRAIRCYDLLATNKSYEVELYRRCGGKEIILQPPGFDEHLHRPMELTAGQQTEFGCDVVFIGTYSPGRELPLTALRETGAALTIWGAGWQKCRDPWLAGRARGRDLSGEQYVLGLCGAKIALGLLSPLVPDKCTTRSVEIPACGVFMLATRTDEHIALFQEDKEAVFFDTPQELAEKTCYYLQHDDLRRQIAQAGRLRCLTNGYSYKSLMKQILMRVEQVRQ
ncbi:MAG: glycosyltransferase [Planctomycetes bacterium]|nr:glycosyltransferase [Planctomycetota bacterium]